MQFYRFIRVKSGIRGRKRGKERRGKRKGSARNFGEEKEKKEKEKQLSGRRKKTRNSKSNNLRWGGSAPKAAGFYTWTPYRRRFGAKKNREKVGND